MEVFENIIDKIKNFAKNLKKIVISILTPYSFLLLI